MNANTKSHIQMRTDKIKISFATKTVRNETDHFVQSQSTINNGRWFGYIRHVSIHFLIH